MLKALLSKYQVHLLLVVLAAVMTLIGVKSVPGAIFTTAYEVTQLHRQVDVNDSTTQAFHHLIAARVDSTNRRVDLDSELLRAMARKECAELGRQKAESYGFPCHETVFHLPSR